MPKSAIPLTDATIRAATPKDKSYKLGDGGGLCLYVTPTGARQWHMKFHRNGKENQLSFGSYPDVSLAAARAERDKVRALLADGQDPVAVKREQKQQEREARQVAQPASAQFRLEMNGQGELMIDKPRNRMRLNATQVNALRAFLVATETG
jgi:hypothetical protein